ncbi:MAG: hypothetical protein LBQ28_04760 [Prevotellaceae bacterium]|jgi:hypothetical protein|nr:hypothetical protein [Prevotellaceae bacterium]
MKKTVFYLLICLFTTNTFAQTEKPIKFMGTFEYRGSAGGFTNLKGKDFKSYDWVVSVGYNFNKYLSARIPMGIEVALLEKDDVRDHAVNSTLGLCVGFNAINTSEDLVEINVSSGNTVGGKYDWKYMYHDFGVNWASGKTKIRWNIGLGLRYYNAHRDMENRMILYGTLGFRMN